MSGSTWYLVNAATAINNFVFIDDQTQSPPFGNDPDTPIALIDDSEAGYYPIIAEVYPSNNQDPPPNLPTPSYPYILFKKGTNTVHITDLNMTNLPFSTVYLDYNAQLNNYEFAGTDLDLGLNPQTATSYQIQALGDSSQFRWEFSVIVEKLLDDGQEPGDYNRHVKLRLNVIPRGNK